MIQSGLIDPRTLCPLDPPNPALRLTQDSIISKLDRPEDFPVSLGSAESGRRAPS